MTSAEFIQTYLPLREGLYRVAFYILESEADAEDAVQDLYVRLWSSIDSLETVRNPKSYCITLMRNICIDRIRRSSRNCGTDIPDMPAPDTDQQKKLESREQLFRLSEAIGKLPDGQRKVLQMKVFEDLSYEEIAEATGMNNLTLRVLLSQARRKLKNVI